MRLMPGRRILDRSASKMRWDELNAALRGTKDEAECRRLIELELRSGAPRKMFVLRAHSRLNKLRAARERRELLGEMIK
jgi:hypothetical protein